MTQFLFETLKRGTPQSARRRILRSRIAIRQELPFERSVPDFLIIGAQRCGTSSLYKFLGAHPQVVPSLRKETRFFSMDYDRGVRWYRAHFPSVVFLEYLRRFRGAGHTFEATPDYFFDPRTPLRVRSVLPHTRFILLLRDPVDRAYSHWQHMRRLGFEDLSFEDAVAAEPSRITKEMEILRSGGLHRARNALRFSYLARGYYVEQLARWLDVFPREQVLILGAEELYSDPPRVVNSICKFVGLTVPAPGTFENYTQRTRGRDPTRKESEISGDLDAYLSEHFAVRNKGLAALAGLSFRWAYD